jgi:hypothetical protein
MNDRPPRIPKYRKHSSGQARVTLNGQDRLLGPYGTAASKAEYKRVVAEWLEQQRQAPLGRTRHRCHDPEGPGPGKHQDEEKPRAEESCRRWSWGCHCLAWP